MAFNIMPTTKPKKETALSTLLDLWHGDHDTAGWQSPTLALNIALLTRPSSALNLAEQIYARYVENGAIQIPRYDQSLNRIIKAGYALYLVRK
jgi:hypothetical protein